MGISGLMSFQGVGIAGTKVPSRGRYVEGMGVCMSRGYVEGVGT